MRGGIERRLTESVDVALNLADDIVVINTFDGGDRLFSRRLACVDCGISMPEMTPRAFSFNSPHGACPDCQGLGAMIDFDPHAARCPTSRSRWRTAPSLRGRRGDQKLVRDALQALSRDFGIDLTVPFAQAAAQVARGAAVRIGQGFEGLVPNLRRRYEEGSWARQEDLEPYRTLRSCPTCKGERLKLQSLSVRVKGRTIAEYVNLPIAEALRRVRQPAADGSRGADRRAHPARDSASGCGS